MRLIDRVLGSLNGCGLGLSGNSAVPDDPRCADGLRTAVFNLEGHLADLGGTAAKALVEGLQNLHIIDRLRRWVGIIARTGDGRRENINAWWW